MIKRLDDNVFSFKEDSSELLTVTDRLSFVKKKKNTNTLLNIITIVGFSQNDVST